MRYAMMIDLDECIGCQACVSACQEQWDSGPGARRNWVHTYEHGVRGRDLGLTFYPGLCMQCAAHPCTGDCPSSATFLNDRGIVVVDPDVCIGCGNCVSLCPYGARRVDDEKGIVEKCNLCEPHVARGEEPACVRTCLAECRVFGDLDDANGVLVQTIAERKAKALVTDEIDVGPKVTFAGAARRGQILAHGGVRRPEPSALTGFWSGYSLPLARFVTPAVAVGSIAGGLVINWIGRRREAVSAGTEVRPRAIEETAPGPDRDPEPTEGLDRSPEPRQGAERNLDRNPEGTASSVALAIPLMRNAPAEGPGASLPREIERHRLGMRVLHWWNALSWLVLLATGTALLAGPGFALFGTAFPDWLADLVGGRGALMRGHVLWGLTWAAVIVPFFLLFKQWGREALHEIHLTPNDLRWLMLKPLAMLGRAREPLPPQDKYNAGQKVFALTALLGTATIIATGLVMTFHLGPAWVVGWAMVAHKLAIAFALMGLSVHLTMAAVVREERPALASMISGRIDSEHAAAHNARWVESVTKKESSK